MYKKFLIAAVIAVVSLGCAGCGEKISEDDLLIATSAKEEVTEKSVESEETTEAVENSKEDSVDAGETEKEQQNAEEQKKENDVYQQALAEVVETNNKAEVIKDTMENDSSLKQTQLNEKAKDLYTLWDDELNTLWKTLKNNLDADTMKNLKEEQRAWIDKKESKAKEATEDVKGGSMEPMIYDMSCADITKERVYELVEYLK